MVRLVYYYSIFQDVGTTLEIIFSTSFHRVFIQLYIILKMPDVKACHAIKEYIYIFFLTCIYEGLNIFRFIMLKHLCW